MRSSSGDAGDTERYRHAWIIASVILVLISVLVFVAARIMHSLGVDETVSTAIIFTGAIALSALVAIIELRYNARHK